MKDATRTSGIVAVEHIRVHTARPFAEVVRSIEAETGVFDAAAVQARLQAKEPPGEGLGAIAAMAGRSGLMRFVALDVPLSLLVAADERGTSLEYDRPSTLLGQFEDPGIDEVARELD